MLVLLVIFMVTAPLLHQGVEVQLPKSVAQNLPKTPEDPLILSITKNGNYYLNETPIPKTQLKERLQLILSRRRDKAVYLKADRNLAYGVVVETMDTLNRLGLRIGAGLKEPIDRAPDPPEETLGAADPLVAPLGVLLRAGSA